ncbi:MAG: phosphopyruvate hydratase [Daejeonella sp.]
MKITKIIAREVLNSRGNPTVEAEITINHSKSERSIVPSGASTGEKEAVELLDGDSKRYNGKGVLNAVKNVNSIIAGHCINKDFESQQQLDEALIALDGTENKSALGANAILAVSMAYAKAAASCRNQPLYQYLAETGKFNTSGTFSMPVPCMNVINGGKHADNNIDFQEFMIAPHNAPSFKEAIRMGEETFHALKSILNKKEYFTGVGDEGGFAPNLKSNVEAVEVIMEAIVQAGYKPGVDISLCLDPASSELWKNGNYVLYKSSRQVLSSEDMLALWKDWTRQYPIVLLEDGMGENDWKGWKLMTEELCSQIELVGDDNFCTNPGILQKGIDEKVANSVLIKLNQIGTVTETLQTINLAYQNNYNCFISHRSGETEDTFIADLTVGTNAGHLKTGSGCRSERVAKFNQLLRIEEVLGSKAVFAGIKAFKNK